MNCPGGDRLMEWLDGRFASAEIEEHLRACSRCSKEADSLRGLSKVFVRSRSKGECLGAGIVSALAAGTLPETNRGKSLEHLAACGECRREVVEVRRLAGAPAIRRSRLWIGATAAAAVAVGVVAWFFLSGEETKRPATRRREVVRETPKPSVPEPVPAPAPAPEPKPEPAPVPVPEPEPPTPTPEPEPVPMAEPRPAPEPTPEPQPEPPPTPVPAPLPTENKPAPPEPSKPARVTVPGTFRFASGRGSFRLDGKNSFKAAREGARTEFREGIELRTLGGDRMKALVGSDALYLGRATELRVSNGEGGETLVELAKGEAHFDVGRRDGMFVVATSQGKVTVTGTRFSVMTDDDETRVAVFEGAVDFETASGRARVEAGREFAARAGRAPEAASEGRLANAWGGLEDQVSIEAESMTLTGAMQVMRSTEASGNGMISAQAHGRPARGGMEGSGSIRAKVKQDGPYVVWVRLQAPHAQADVTVAAGDQSWPLRGIAAGKAGWQWVRAGIFEAGREPFALEVTDRKGGVLVDRFLLTSDKTFEPRD